MKIEMPLMIISLTFWFNMFAIIQTEFHKICDPSLNRIDATIRQLETNFAYLVVTDSVFKLDVSAHDKVSIAWSAKVKDWSEVIELPIDMITTNEFTTNSIGLINCKVGTEWMIDLKRNQYKDSKQTFECKQNAFEYLVGKEGEKYLRDTIFKLENWSNSNEIKVRGGYSFGHWLRSNDSKDVSVKGIKLVDDYENDKEISSTYPFASLMRHQITAAFIGPDIHWYLFGGPYYCRVKVNRQTFELCEPLLVKDWITDCSESESIVNNKDLSIWLMAIMAVIAIGLVSLIVVLLLIYKEKTKKGSTKTSKGSEGQTTMSQTTYRSSISR